MCYSLWYNAPTVLPAVNIVGALYHTQSSAPEDGRDKRPKHVELIGITNKPLLLHLVGVYIIYMPSNQDCIMKKNGRRSSVTLFWETLI